MKTIIINPKAAVKNPEFAKLEQLEYDKEKVYDKINDWASDLRKQYNDPIVFKIKCSFWSLMLLFSHYNPELIAAQIKALVAEKRLVTNLDEEGVYPFDAYVFPVDLLTEITP